MDTNSIYNGVLKFDHSQACLTLEEYTFLLNLLEHEFGHIIAQETLPLDSVSDIIVDDSASGFPYAQTCGSLKGQVLKKRTVLQLYEDFLSFTQVLSCTLKNEIRTAGKEARAFRPANASSIVAAIHLFHRQNESLQNQWDKTPLALGFSSPGRDLSIIWQSLLSFGGKYLSIDGAQWDAHFPLVFAAIICQFRLNHLPPQSHAPVKRYYEQMYCGYTMVQGVLTQLTGNPSGHFNTSVDNSLAEFMSVRLIMHRLHIHPSSVKFYVSGDDLVIATKDERLNPTSMQQLANTFGVYYEFLHEDNFSPFFELLFVGTHPLLTHRGLRYGYLRDKQLASLHFCHVNSTPEDLFAKCVSIASNLYYDYEAFTLAKKCALRLLNAQIVQLTPLVQSMWEAVSDESLSILYEGFEAGGGFLSFHRLHELVLKLLKL